MLDEYRIEPTSIGQYLDSVYNEDIKIDQAVQRSFCWGREMMNSLIYSGLSRKIYIPNFILAEENKSNSTKQTYVIDAGQRTETLYRFKYGGYKISNTLRKYLIPYKKNKVDKNGEYIRDEYGNIEAEIENFDIRKKTYSDLPDELKRKFDGCPLTIVIYQDCTPEETAELVQLYNNHIGMNVPQKALTYIGKFANEIKRIKDTNRFLIDCTALTELEKTKGVWERVISESVMSVNYFDEWKQDPKKMCDYLNKNSSEEEYKKMENYFNRLIPYSDKMDNPEIAAQFSSKNFFIWMMLFNKFTKLNISDDKFGVFLNLFASELQYKEVDGEDWTTINSDRHTKHRNVIVKKLEYLEQLMNEFLHIEEKAIGENATEENEDTRVKLFIEENVEIIVEDSDIEFCHAILKDLIPSDNNNSKLLDEKNTPSMLSIVAYSCEIDFDLDSWIIDYFNRYEDYIVDQKQNYLHMKEDLDNYIESTKNVKEQKTA